jgi:thiamine kinase-like enzyme
MEDAGQLDLEQAPQAYFFIEAARELARLRTSATENLSRNKISQLVLNKYTVTAEDFIQQLDDLERASTESNVLIIQKALFQLPKRIKQLYQEVPFTLVHHDYQAKNLLIQGEHILPIDWSNAYLSPHLGDLHRLICEAHSMSCVSTNEMLEAYLDEIGSNEMKMEHLIWQVKMGGICWLIRTLRWLVYGGTDTIPGSVDWLPGIFEDMDKLLDQLDKSDLYV